ncbi:Hypothetical protein HDN1F_27930 [gamma proteobacterium HdN1]|nr:Hypothetical protein HDN1F_27930 [gamma proteobacterium HdN1]
MSGAALKRLGSLINLKRGYDLSENYRRLGPYPVISSAGITGYHNEYMVKGQFQVESKSVRKQKSSARSLAGLFLPTSPFRAHAPD